LILNNTIEKKEIIKLSNQQKMIEIPIEEKYRGNFKINIVFVKDNRVYIDEHIFKVPFSNKKLDLEFASFRNKLLPGQNEEWKIKIRNNKGEKVFAEMLAGMYDASLDAFSQNNWFLDLYKNNQNLLSWRTSNSFGINGSNSLVSVDNSRIQLKNQFYDQINYFGLNIFRNHGYGQIRGSRSGALKNGMETDGIVPLTFNIGNLAITMNVRFHRVQPASSTGLITSTVAFTGVGHQNGLPWEA